MGFPWLGLASVTDENFYRLPMEISIGSPPPRGSFFSLEWLLVVQQPLNKKVTKNQGLHPFL
jgi:hypothetical protein